MERVHVCETDSGAKTSGVLNGFEVNMKLHSSPFPFVVYTR